MLKFDKGREQVLKINIQMGPNATRTKLCGMTRCISKNHHATWDYIRGDMGHGDLSDRGKCHFLNLTSYMGIPQTWGCLRWKETALPPPPYVGP